MAMAIITSVMIVPVYGDRILSTSLSILVVKGLERKGSLRLSRLIARLVYLQKPALACPSVLVWPTNPVKPRLGRR